jgi:hypothetical protein
MDGAPAVRRDHRLRTSGVSHLRAKEAGGVHVITLVVMLCVGTYLLVGAVVTLVCVRSAPNRWVVDWAEYGNTTASGRARISRVATRFVFWLWPIPVVCMSIYGVLKLIEGFFSLSDSVTRLAAGKHREIK